jgi:SAM-dependent methyltransferase
MTFQPSSPIDLKSLQHSLFGTGAFKRLWGLTRRVSLTRALQYEVLGSLNLSGKLLDFGGGNRADYKNLVSGSLYNSVNIDPAIEPTWIVGIRERVPCADGEFDTILSMNTLEHIFDAKFVLEEMSRLLKPSGVLAISTPFLYPIHGHPDDFFRPTPSWYVEALKEVGFVNVEVLPLAWGPFTTAQTCAGIPGPFKGLRRRIAFVFDFTLNLKRRGQAGDKFLQRYATALFVCARKAE